MKKYIALLLALVIAAPAFAIEKNVGSQRLEVQEIDSATGAPKTGDAAQLTAYASIDGGTLTALTDTSATESSSTNAPGVYWFDLSQAETNGTNILFSGKSSTSGCYIVPRMVATVPSGFSTLTIASNAVNADAKKINAVSTASVTAVNANLGTTQPVNFTGTSTTAYVKTDAIDLAGTALTGRDIGASVLLSSGTGTGQLNFTSGVVQSDAAKINGISTSGVTSVAANIGTAQLVNFTGTSFSALVKTDSVDWAGTALASPDTAGYPKVTVKNGTGTGELSLSSGVVNADAKKINAVSTGSVTTVNANIGTRAPTTLGGGGAISSVVSQTVFQPATTAAAFDDELPPGTMVVILDGDTGTRAVRRLVTYVASTNRVTIDAAPAFTLTTDCTVEFYPEPKQLTEIKTKTDFLPSATAGATGGVFIAGTNAATTITTGLTANITGNLTGNVSGSVGSVTGAVGSVTGGVGGAVGSVSGVTFPTNFGSLSIDGSGRVDIGKILGTASAGTAGYVAPDWAHINAPTTTVNLSGTTLGAITSVSDKTGYRLSSTGVGDIWNEVQSGHTTAGTFGKYLDSAVSGVSAGGLTAADIATAVWTDLLASSDFSTSASVGKLLKDDVDAATSSRMATYSQPTGFLTATFPATVASPTNITAGTITTATNLTNAPTSGDFTATMKTSLNAATPTGGDTSGTTTLLSRLSSARAGYLDNINNSALSTTTAQTGDSYARLGAPAGASIAADIAGVSLGGGAAANITAIKAKTDNLPSSPAAVGSAMTLTSGERTAVGSALLAITNGAATVETQLRRLDAAVSSISVEGGLTPSQVFNQDPVPARTSKLGTRADGVTIAFPDLNVRPGEKTQVWVDCSNYAGVNIGNVTNASSSNATKVAVDSSGETKKLVSFVLDETTAADGDTAVITADATPFGTTQVIKIVLNIKVKANQ